MPKLFSKLITSTEQHLSQMAGKGVQIYSETRIANYLQHAFEMVFKEYFMPEYSGWFTVGLDGVNGLATSDMAITSFDDIGVVYVENTEHKIKLAPTNININRMTGTWPVYMGPRLIINATDVKRPFVVYPKTAVGNLNIYGRRHPQTAGVPSDFGSTDTVMCDSLVLEYCAAWMYAEDDATNPGQIAKFRDLFNKRLTQLQSAAMNLPSPLDARMVPILNEWV